MRVLWFSVSPSLYSSNGSNHGLGWIASLERIAREDKDIELGVAFEHTDDIFKIVQNGVVYYPMNVFKDKTDIKRRHYHVDVEEKLFMPRCLQVIEDFNPDIIHVFGSEWCFGLVQEYTNIPVVIHMQGSMPPYENAMFPPGYSWYEDHAEIPWWHIPWKIKHKLWRKRNQERVEREERILRGCKYFMGRTEWDNALTRLYSPYSKYYKCWEALRPMFVNTSHRWECNETPHKYVLLSTGPSRLKGIDTVLKTAKLLKENTNLEFEWRLIGTDRNGLNYYERHDGINPESVNVKCLGVLDGEGVKEQLLNCDLYVLPSYMDNSPNSVCEAMCLGVPIISTFSGGIPSLIDNGKTGVLVPANEPHRLAYEVKILLSSKGDRIRLGKYAHYVAMSRHNPECILYTLKDIYSQVVHEKVVK